MNPSSRTQGVLCEVHHPLPDTVACFYCNAVGPSRYLTVWQTGCVLPRVLMVWDAERQDYRYACPTCYPLITDQIYPLEMRPWGGRVTQ